MSVRTYHLLGLLCGDFVVSHAYATSSAHKTSSALVTSRASTSRKHGKKKANETMHLGRQSDHRDGLWWWGQKSESSEAVGSLLLTHFIDSGQDSLIDKICAPCEGKKEGGPNLCSVCGQDSEYKALIDEGGVMCAKDSSYERCQLPQLPAASHDGEPADPKRKLWEDKLRLERIDIAAVNVPVADIGQRFRPSQKKIQACKTCGMVRSAQKCFVGDNPSWPTKAECEARKKDGCFCAWSHGIAVTEDGHVLDGHHRWAATWLLFKDKEMPKPTDAGHVSNVDMYQRSNEGQADDEVTIKRILEVAKKYDGLVKHSKCGDAADNSNSHALKSATSKVWLITVLMMCVAVWQ